MVAYACVCVCVCCRTLLNNVTKNGKAGERRGGRVGRETKQVSIYALQACHPYWLHSPLSSSRPLNLPLVSQHIIMTPAGSGSLPAQWETVQMPFTQEPTTNRTSRTNKA